jgi:hypothetical protein
LDEQSPQKKKWDDGSDEVERERRLTGSSARSCRPCLRKRKRRRSREGGSERERKSKKKKQGKANGISRRGGRLVAVPAVAEDDDLEEHSPARRHGEVAADLGGEGSGADRTGPRGG